MTDSGSDEVAEVAAGAEASAAHADVGAGAAAPAGALRPTGVPADRPVTVLVLELDPSNPPLRLGPWLTDAGAVLEVRRLHAGDEVPGSAVPWDAAVILGGAFGVYDDDRAPYLARVRALVAAMIADATPLLAIALGAQLLAVAAGGRVQRATGGYRLGASLAAKRDLTEQDLLLGSVPITPDIMQFHRDSIVALPAGSELLLASVNDPVEAFRVGSTAWGLQFHIETSADDLRAWRTDPAREVGDDDIARTAGRFGAGLDDAEEMMRMSWRAVAGRFVELVRTGIPQTPTGRHAPRLPIVAGDLGG